MAFFGTWLTGLFLSTWVTFWSSRTWEENIHHTQAELQHLQETYVKAEKWEFYTSTVSFLGYIVAEGNLEMDPVKVSAISTWTMPENWKLVQHFLSFSTVVSFRIIAPWQLPLLPWPLPKFPSDEFPLAEKAFWLSRRIHVHSHPPDAWPYPSFLWM